MKKCIIFVLTISILVILFCSGCSASKLQTTCREMSVTTFQNDYELLQVVVNSLMSLDYKEYKSVHFYGADMVTNRDGEIITTKISTIMDESLKNAILELREKGYSTISKSNSCISFSRWADSKTWRAGYVFLMNNCDSLDIQFLTYQEALNTADWYYYESDYNQWKNSRGRFSD